MSQTSSNPSPTAGKGKAFFDRADQVADTGNWDLAIEYYLEGIQREPENLLRGHQKLREVAMKRLAKGGKPTGFMDKMKRGQGKDPIANLVNAEYLWAKEPGSDANMEAILKAAMALGHKEVIKWVAGMLLESQRQATRKNKRILQTITTTYHDIEEYRLALQACEMAKEADPNNAQIQDILADLMAKDTIQRGKYDQEGDFTKGVKDYEAQRALIEKDSLQQSVSFREKQANDTREEYLQAPTVPGKIYAYIDALLLMQDEGCENEAVDILLKSYNDTNSYQYKLRVGDIRMKQMTRRFRKLRDAGDKAGAAQALRDQLEFELKEFAERAANIPTDMGIKYELGRRQLVAGKLDEAIGSLQQAKRDNRHALQATSLLGQAFEKKGWLKEAADTFEAALAGDVTEDREKELRYHLGTVYEKMNELPKAQDQYSRVAQLDFTFKDVRQRLEEIRKRTA